MAVDTHNKRMALMGLGSPVPRILPNPDGSFNSNNDRYMLLFLYPLFAEIPPEEIPRRRGHSSGGILWPWEKHRKRLERETEEFLLLIDNDNF